MRCQDEEQNNARCNIHKNSISRLTFNIFGDGYWGINGCAMNNSTANLFLLINITQKLE